MIAQLPSVADALEAFRVQHRIPQGAYDARRFLVRVGSLVITLPNPGLLPLHDLHHVALDIPPTFWGEVEVSAFELRAGAPTMLIAFLCVSALCLGALLSPLRVVRAWRRYSHVRSPPGRASFYVNLGPHPPRLWPEDLERLHHLWLGLTSTDFASNLHHRDVVGVALRRLERDLEGERRGEAVVDLNQELRKD